MLRCQSFLAVLVAVVARPLIGQQTQPCTGILMPGVVVAVRDSITGQPIAGHARGTVRQDSFVDSLRTASYSSVDGTILSLQGAHERDGTYDVFIMSPGYAPWLMTGVQVRRDECHVVTVYLVARLKPI